MMLSDPFFLADGLLEQSRACGWRLTELGAVRRSWRFPYR